MDFKDLTKEQIEEAKACKTTEERINFLKEHNISLPDSYLEKISGGGEGDAATYYGQCTKCSGYLHPTGRTRPGEYLETYGRMQNLNVINWAMSFGFE